MADAKEYKTHEEWWWDKGSAMGLDRGEDLEECNKRTTKAAWECASLSKDIADVEVIRSMVNSLAVYMNATPSLVAGSLVGALWTKEEAVAIIGETNDK